jgi:hypothetical protein
MPLDNSFILQYNQISINMNSCLCKGCRKPPVVYCTCSDLRPGICSDHLRDHLISNAKCRPTDHLQNINLLTDSKELDLQCNEVLEMIEEIKQRVIFKTKETVCAITGRMYKGIEELNSNGARIKEIKREMRKQSIVEKMGKKLVELSLGSKCTSEIERILKTIKETEEKLNKKIDIYEIDKQNEKCLKDYKEKVIEVEKCETLIKEIKDKAVRFMNSIGCSILEWNDFEKIFQTSSEYNSKFFCCFEHITKNFCIVDVTSNKDRKIVLTGLNSNLTTHAAYCLLPDNRIFVYGGHETPKNQGYIINIDNQSIIPIASHRSTGFPIECAYYDGWVYVFGGFSGSYLKDCEKYCVANNSWTNIANLPTTSGL